MFKLIAKQTNDDSDSTEKRLSAFNYDFQIVKTDISKPPCFITLQIAIQHAHFTLLNIN